MNKVLLIVVILFCFSCSGKKNNTQLHSQSAKTTIKFDEEIHDLGIIEAGEVVAYNFTYKNTGENNFMPDSILIDCGCIKTEYKKTPVTPNNTGVITVYFNSDGLYGKQFKSIEVFGNITEPKQIAIFAEVKNEQIQIQY